MKVALNDLNRKRAFFALLAVLIMALIFFFSGETAVESGATSSGLIDFFLHLFVPHYRAMSRGVQLAYIARYSHFVRKLAHFTIYASLGFAVSGFTLTLSRRPWFVYFVSQFYGSLYALSDEWHQGFSDGRHPGWDDVLLDSIGVACGIAVLFLLVYCIRRWKSRETKSH